MISKENKVSLSNIEQPSLIDLWELDVSNIKDNPSGANYFLFCNEANEKGEPFVMWNGKKYNSLPVSAEGFAVRTRGASNRPTITFSNVKGLFTGIIVQFDQLVGASINRFTVLSTHLDASNFVNGNPKADPSQYVLQRFLVNSLDEQNKHVAKFSLALPSETDGAKIPSRTMMAGVCQHKYRGEGCGYTGGPVATIDDLKTDKANEDACSKSLTGCCARWGVTGVLPFGAFVGIDRLGR